MTLLLDRSTQQALLEIKRVLIIDDEEPIRRLLGYMLQTHGYETVLASDAREARTRLDEQPFALILCDVNMPGESGMDLVRDILSQYPHTAVIMVTGLDSSVLANAAAPFLSKLGPTSTTVEEKHQASILALMEKAQALIANEKIQFLFIHLPIPHPPGIYDRTTGKLRGSGTYIDNLALSDRSLGELMNSLNATASAANTTLILCSDHSWRVPMWKSDADWSAEEEAPLRGNSIPARCSWSTFRNSPARLPSASLSTRSPCMQSSFQCYRDISSRRQNSRHG